jgi:hypothetical protein
MLSVDPQALIKSVEGRIPSLEAEVASGWATVEQLHPHLRWLSLVMLKCRLRRVVLLP